MRNRLDSKFIFVVLLLFVQSTIPSMASLKREIALELADGEITTIAGNVPLIGDGGLALNATSSGFGGTAIDREGNLIIADSFNNTVRRINPKTGIIITIAGNGLRGFAGDGGLAINAKLAQPADVAVDSNGNIFIADLLNHRIRRVDAVTRVITTVAGNGQTPLTSNDFGDNIPAIMATIGRPYGIDIDGQNNLFIIDSRNLIRRIDADSSLIATVFDASVRSSFTVDKAGNIFVGRPYRILRIDSSNGNVDIVAGRNSLGFTGDGGPAPNAKIGRPTDIKTDGNGNIFFTDSNNNRVRKVDAVTGIITTVAGGGDCVAGQNIFFICGDGGIATDAGISSPNNLAIDMAGNLYISHFGDLSFNVRVRRVAAQTNIITSLAGRIPAQGDGGPATAAEFTNPNSVAVDRAGNIFIADELNRSVRRVDAITGIITTIVGNQQCQSNTTGLPCGDGGPANKASLIFPSALAVDNSGNLFISDTGTQRVRRVDARTGIIETVAGGGSCGTQQNNYLCGDGGPATTASIGFIFSLAVDNNNNLYIGAGDRVRRIDARTGIIETIAGGGNCGTLENNFFCGDGDLATKATLGTPLGIAVDSQRNLFLIDRGRIRRVDAVTNIITTVAGDGRDFSVDPTILGDGGLASQAPLPFTRNIAVDDVGNLFIADLFHNRIRRIDAVTGIISTIAGNGEFGFIGDDGPATAAALNTPISLVVDRIGNLLIADPGNRNVRLIKGVGSIKLQINSANYDKLKLTITGSGFTKASKVFVNGKNISAKVINISENRLVVKGSKNELNLSKGQNRVEVFVKDLQSNIISLAL